MLILTDEQISPFKETLILYTLSGAILLISTSWILMGIQIIRNQK